MKFLRFIVFLCLFVGLAFAATAPKHAKANPGVAIVCAGPHLVPCLALASVSTFVIAYYMAPDGASIEIDFPDRSSADAFESEVEAQVAEDSGRYRLNVALDLMDEQGQPTTLEPFELFSPALTFGECDAWRSDLYRYAHQLASYGFFLNQMPPGTISTRSKPTNLARLVVPFMMSCQPIQ